MIHVFTIAVSMEYKIYPRRHTISLAGTCRWRRMPPTAKHNIAWLQRGRGLYIMYSAIIISYTYSSSPRHEPVENDYFRKTSSRGTRARPYSQTASPRHSTRVRSETSVFTRRRPLRRFDCKSLSGLRNRMFPASRRVRLSTRPHAVQTVSRRHRPKLYYGMYSR